MRLLRVISLLTLLAGNFVPAKAKEHDEFFPSYLSDGFDYSSFTKLDASKPPKSLIYQSNGFMALQERGFGGQRMLIPVSAVRQGITCGTKYVGVYQK